MLSETPTIAIQTLSALFNQLLDMSNLVSKSRGGFAECISKEISTVLKDALKEKTLSHKKCLEFLSNYSDDFQMHYEEFEKV